MDRARWQRLETLFHEAAALDLAEREAYLDSLSPLDSELRSQIEALLAADGGESRIGELIAGTDLPASAAAPAKGTRIGAYRVVRSLGHGGMGQVFLAERADDQFEHQVAIKLLGQRFVHPDLRRRFDLERRVLARLHHPNIAGLMDGGTTEDGLPYVVMEYVDGEPIDQYARAESLPVRRKVQLFQAVCAAVEEAHRNLIVHRDLKPGNILVARTGMPKLLDFGIAKLLDPGDHPGNDTRTGFAPMTPSYASPEQVRGEAVSTASDIYSLGVVLYELLAGKRPYNLQGTGRAALTRAMETVDPVPPGVHAPGVSRDLDNIVLKAMHKDPARRYGSVAQFSEDLQRYLDGRTVSARPDTWSYRTARFIQRNRGGVAAAALLVLAVGLLTGFYLTRLASERDRARLEADKAEQVASFLTDLFKVATPFRDVGETVTARELLDAGTARIDTGLAGQPEVQATMLGVVGNVYGNLGLYGSADSLLERSLERHRTTYGPASLETADALSALSGLRTLSGQIPSADTLARQAFAIRRDRLPPDDVRITRSIGAMAETAGRLGEFQRADSLYRVAVARVDVPPVDSILLAMMLTELGDVLQNSGNSVEADSIYRRTLRIFRSRSPEDGMSVGIVLGNLAGARRSLGDYESSDTLYRQSIEIQRRFLGDEHPFVASLMGSLALTLRDGQYYEEAESMFRQAIALQEGAGADERSLATDLANLAGVLQALGRFDEAERLHLRALEIRRRSLGAEHHYVAISQNEIAQLYVAMGRFALAERYFRDGLALRRKVLSPEHPYIAYSLIGLGGLLADHGRAEEAESLLREALAIREAALPAGHWRIAEAMTELGACLSRLSRYGEADSLMNTGFPIIREARGPDDRLTRRVAGQIAWMAESRGDLVRSTEVGMEPGTGKP